MHREAIASRRLHLTRRELLQATGAGLASMAFAGCDAPARTPNVVLIMADDLGAKALGCYGNREIATPRLDALAASGMRFRTCWATPLCTPTRVMLLTGRYASSTGWFNFMGRAYSPLPQSRLFPMDAYFTVGEAMQAAGYHTALAGKWQLPGVIPSMVHEAGFDEYLVWSWLHRLPQGMRHEGRWEHANQIPARYWHPSMLRDSAVVPTTAETYGPDVCTDFLVDFLKRRRNEPFFAYYPMLLPHPPYDPTPNPSASGARIPGSFRASVEYMDHLVGRLLDTLDELGLSENTVVVFTSDNGSPHDGKAHAVAAGAHVPLIARWPGHIPAGVTSDALVDLSDILPTLAEFAGARLPADLTIDGRSLVTTLRGAPGADHREWIFSYLGAERMLRDQRWLLEGGNRFFECHDRQGRESCRDVSGSNAPEVVRARSRFDKILGGLPGPEALAGELILPRDLAPGGIFGPKVGAFEPDRPGRLASART